MNQVPLEIAVLWPALVAGLLVAATHVPLGIRVLQRGIVFIDLAVAQIAGLGVIFADWLGFPPKGAAVQVAALAAALGGALLLHWTERLWPEVQEAIIGVAFVVAANVALLLLAVHPHGPEHLKDLLVGQILWVSPAQLPWMAAASVAILGAWLTLQRRVGLLGFYVLFACAVTMAVQFVGLYLVFATLIIPALGTYGWRRRRVALCYGIAAGGYASGLALSVALDLPAGPLVVCAMTAIAIPVFLCPRGPRV